VREGTLACKPLDFEKHPLVFMVEYIYRLTTLSQSKNHNTLTCTCIYTLVGWALSQMCGKTSFSCGLTLTIH